MIDTYLLLKEPKKGLCFNNYIKNRNNIYKYDHLNSAMFIAYEILKKNTGQDKGILFLFNFATYLMYTSSFFGEVNHDNLQTLVEYIHKDYNSIDIISLKEIVVRTWIEGY